MRDYNEKVRNQALELDDPLAGFTRKPHLKPNLTQDSLDEITGIAPEAVRVNGAGRLTQEQRADLLKEIDAETDGVRLLLTIFLGVALLLAFIFLSETLPMVNLVIGAAVISGGLLAFYYRRNRQKRTALETRVERVDGIPQLRALGRLDTPTHFVMIVSGQIFQISGQMYDKLEQYDLPICRVYYAAKTKQLLSIEVRQAYDDEKLKNDLMLDEDGEKRKNDELPPEEEPAEIEGRK